MRNEIDFSCIVFAFTANVLFLSLFFSFIQFRTMIHIDFFTLIDTNNYFYLNGLSINHFVDFSSIILYYLKLFFKRINIFRLMKLI